MAKSKRGCIYIITHIESGKRYVGKWEASSFPEKRFKSHKAYAIRGATPLISRAIMCYGADAFTFEKIIDCPVEACPALEAYYAEMYNVYMWDYQLTYDGKWIAGGYNMIWCGDLGHTGIKASSETKQKLREAHLGVPLSKEHSANIGLALKGKPKSAEHVEKVRQANIGRIVSEETKQKLSESHKGKKLPAEQRAKMSESQRGRVVTEETGRKISMALTGKKMSEETKQKISQAGTGRKISEEHKIKISEALKGKKKSPEHIAKVSAALTGKKMSEEARKNMSEAKKARSLPLKPDTKAAIEHAHGRIIPAPPIAPPK